MNATTFHTEITNFMEANGFDNDSYYASEGTSMFTFEAPGRLPLLIEFMFEEGDKRIEMCIDEVDENSTDNLEREFFTTLEEVQEFISDYFNL